MGNLFIRRLSHLAKKESDAILFGTVVANMEEHDTLYLEAVITSGKRCRKRYGEAVVLQSPRSRSAPWVRMDNNVYPEGVAQKVCTVCHVLCVTPSGYVIILFVDPGCAARPWASE